MTKKINIEELREGNVLVIGHGIAYFVTGIVHVGPDFNVWLQHFRYPLNISKYAELEIIVNEDKPWR